MRSFPLELFADYFQFYLQDEASRGIDGDSWPLEAHNRWLAVEPFAIGVRTARNMTVPVVIEVYDAAPAGDGTAWDYMIEASFAVPSGKIVVAGCTDYFPEALRIDVAPGPLRARIAYAALDSVEGLEGNDHYRVQLWPSPHDIIRILRPLGRKE